MTEVLIDLLSNEVDAFTGQSLEKLYGESESFLLDLKQMETDLTQDIEREEQGKEDYDNMKVSVDANLSETSWYKSSITHLKLYNSTINKFFKNVLNNPKFSLNLDEAYIYPLYKVDYNLLKAISIHLLKSGEYSTALDLDIDYPNTKLMNQFKDLKLILSDISNHDLSLALKWLSGVPGGSTTSLKFKFNVLQMVLLLNKSGEFTIEDTASAFAYSKDNLTEFFSMYLKEISSLMLLFIYGGRDQKSIHKLIKKSMAFSGKLSSTADSYQERQFINDLLKNFDSINSNHEIFTTLANEFVNEFCNSLGLSKESSLFQSVLAGFIYLPSFYKFSKIQKKLNKPIEQKEFSDDVNFDLPFQLPDSSRFLFRYHPIFICPVSKEQLMPATKSVTIYPDGDEHQNKRICIEEDAAHPNSVVVLNLCHHLALMESVYHLSKKGTDCFKCHYCYTKHKYSDITNAFFIDL